MFFQLDLLALLLAPVMAYLAAALIFAFVERKDDKHSLALFSTDDSYPRRPL